ncbi:MULTISPECIES: formate dehydrogenase subunit delta [unclassified Rhizobium]|uniref:formate dehydrogenase subunit delta n=1 Tax=unclassified Rhizobium TaxID=2613769 RepID=UPI001ADBEE10|nr:MULTISPECIES: formate dehydrogenase subunit delta [unclassified Rhizobium]MBO9126768.1 formate dehydrogenase subunit delta [Rhizobium sp. 16-488-2b]MBO9177215.1 formate dehydrogenase subunit delta [Rhizobium sp. 16-488-2a]
MSHGTHDKLVYMANQIAGFFATQPEAEAAQGVASHINKFWEPRMRRQLFEILEQDKNGLSPLVLQAVPLIKRPVSKTTPRTETTV